MSGATPTLDPAARIEVHGYTIVKALGAGASGEVYEATGAGGARVAIKLLRSEMALDAALQRRFSREAQICAEMKSAHIVPVLAHGVHAGRPYLVMPLLSGHDLETWLARTGALAPEVAVAIVLQACDALAIAHARGVVHRDLKPANIFLDEGADGILTTVVCDFGIAKIIDEDGTLTASGAVLGTPLYMAPEQLVDSKRVDARCDVWALGMMLYHLLAGRAALEDKRSIAELMVAISTNTITPLQSLAPWVSPALARIVHAALLPLDKRFPTVDAMATALHRWCPAPALLRSSALASAPAAIRADLATIAALPTDHGEVGLPEDANAGDGKTADADRLLGKTLGDKYRLVKRLGTGGMGAVYEAVDPTNGRTAVKVMHGEPGAQSAEAARRFTREMHAVRAVDSPHVVKPIDFGVDPKEGIPFFVMELLSGRDLASLLASTRSLAPQVAVELFLQACAALRAAHAHGIIHRDIKPSNLFLHEGSDGTVVLKVCDFGIAKRVEQDVTEASTELTRSGGLLGSPLYMAPEHAKNAKNVDARSDVWSLGLSLHETLSGVRPWQGCTSVGEVIVAICTQPVAPLSSVAPWVDDALSRVVERALAQDPAQRWSSMDELMAALRPFGLARGVSVGDLAPALEAGDLPSGRAISVLPPGAVTSGSLRGGARVALVASVSPPLEKRGGRKWAAVAAAALALALGGGFVALGAFKSSPAHDPPAERASAASIAAPSVVAAPGPSALGTANASVPPSASAPPVAPVASAAESASPSDGGGPRGRPRASVASAAASTPVGAAPAVPASSASPAASTRPSTRTDGRASSRKDDQ